jgi:hypothetical protein
LKKRNVKALKDILSNMSKVTYRTTWQEAQRLLLDNVDFVNDTELQSNPIVISSKFYFSLFASIDMDKEDALIVFEDHIRELERIHEDGIEGQRKYIRRTNRKNREAFLVRIDFIEICKNNIFLSSIFLMNYTNKVNFIPCHYGSNYSVLFPMMNDLVKCLDNPVKSNRIISSRNSLVVF